MNRQANLTREEAGYGDKWKETGAGQARTHGENYGNWMSAPVFYMVGALVVLMAVLCVISHFIPGMRLIGVLALAAAVAVLFLLAWITWIRRAVCLWRGRHDGAGP